MPLYMVIIFVYYMYQEGNRTLKYKANFTGATTAKGHTEGSQQPRSVLHTHRQSWEAHMVNKQFWDVWERAEH